MKLALSILLVFGLTQLCAADSSDLPTPQVQEVIVTVLEPEDMFGDYTACLPANDCNYPCVKLSTADAVYTSSPQNPFCTPGSEARSPGIMAYAKPNDRNALDYLKPVGLPFNIKCRPGENIEGGKIYHCGLNIVEDSTTSTTTTTTTTTTTKTTTTTTSTTTATTTTTTIIPTIIPTTLPSICSNNINVFNKKKGNGYSGDCCKTEADCKDDCVKGRCNGPTRKTIQSSTTKSSSTTKKTTLVKPTQTPSVCKSGYRGKKKGNGPKGACCSSHRDCKEDCIKGKCN